MKYSIFTLVLLCYDVSAQESRCYGTTSDGRLEHGVKLPASGENFEGYSLLARMAGRTYVHSKVNDTILAAYRFLQNDQPGKVFKYAETGYKTGGPFKPHKTHRNGLSVDFMVPVVDTAGRSVHLPTHPLNRFGYDIEFDENSRYKHFTIDYEAMAAHIVALHKEAKKNGFDIWRVIFDPQLQRHVMNTRYSEYLSDNIQFSKKRSWVRHDEHYHIDFDLPCL